VAGELDFCTYGGVFSVLHAITVVEYTYAGLTARTEVIRCNYSMYVTDTIAYISVTLTVRFKSGDQHFLVKVFS
jgi:hypothetical protein